MHLPDIHNRAAVGSCKAVRQAPLQGKKAFQNHFFPLEGDQGSIVSIGPETGNLIGGNEQQAVARQCDQLSPPPDEGEDVFLGPDFPGFAPIGHIEPFRGGG